MKFWMKRNQVGETASAKAPRQRELHRQEQAEGSEEWLDCQE